jgi:hypothetical protein
MLRLSEQGPHCHFLLNSDRRPKYASALRLRAPTTDFTYNSTQTGVRLNFLNLHSSFNLYDVDGALLDE